MNRDDDPFGILGDARPLCGVCFRRLSPGSHYAEIKTNNIGTQIVCAECLVQFAEKRVAELEAENARLRDLLRPIAETFADDCKDSIFRDRPDEARWSNEHTYGQLRSLCTALGIKVPE